MAFVEIEIKRPDRLVWPHELRRNRQFLFGQKIARSKSARTAHPAHVNGPLLRHWRKSTRICSGPTAIWPGAIPG